MSSDVAEIEKVLQVYFDGLYEGDTKKLGSAFHPAAHLYAAGPDGKAIDWPRAEWFKYVEGRPSAKSQGSARADRIVSVDFSGPTTAFAKVECQIPPRYFTDYLTLLKTDGRWQVIAKAYHTVMKDK
ncbi:MAG: nuclear transport factor 2 family protein [Alphaproteobacteria bacterium]|nr:nuclear transport factor 2 family protein [Alphaproteobacteria bacterium]